MKFTFPKQAALAVWAAALVAGHAFAAEITVLALDNNVSIEALVAKFNAQNPKDKVNLKKVSYQFTIESMPVQVAAGKGPDIGNTNDLGGLAKFYLDLSPYIDTKYWEREFGPTLAWLRGTDQKSKAIYGLPEGLTVSGGFVNLTLFAQAGVPVPKPGATWEEWAAASHKVAKATNTPIAMEMDRSGHRFASLAISYGAKLVDEQGMPVIDDGLKRAMHQFVKWHADGVMPMDLWGAIGGATQRDNFTDFINGQVVFYYGGSWSLRKMDKEVGDLFDWKVVDSPCGPSSCTGMPGGGAAVAFKNTKEPKLVARFLEFLAQEENQRDGANRSRSIPASATLVKTGIKYDGASRRTQEGLDTFMRQVPKMAPAAYNFQGWPFARSYMNAMTTRISQVLQKELTVDAAAARIKEDVELAIKAAKK